MVKSRNNNNSHELKNQGYNSDLARANKITAFTGYEYCNELLSPFGGLQGLEKFLDLVKFKEIFEKFYKCPSRRPTSGDYDMVHGFIMLLFTGFCRLWHFIYIKLDSMMCAILNVTELPNVTTYWRYMNSLGINEGKSLLDLSSALRERVWKLCDINYETIHINIDTTVETIYGDQQGGRKGHNTKNRGKKGYRPILCFIEETREYFTGKLRKGETVGGKELSNLILTFRKYLPGCVKRVILRGDGEFISWDSIKAAFEEGYEFVFANKVCNPPFDSLKWYKVSGRGDIEYNECIYRPLGWELDCRFVAMRIMKKELKGDKPVQLELIEDAKYTYRVFVTSMMKRSMLVIDEYDKRADCENLIGEAKREGLAAIPSRKFSSNYAYFQIVMLVYNIWRSFKMLAGKGLLRGGEKKALMAMKRERVKDEAFEIIDNNIRIARLKVLLIAAKITNHSNTNKVKYSVHDSRVPKLFKFYRYLDRRRHEMPPWLNGRRWNCKHMSAFVPLMPAPT